MISSRFNSIFLVPMSESTTLTIAETRELPELNISIQLME
jgi:hypothetical protein